MNTLLISVLLTASSGLVYAYLAYLLNQRPVSAEARPAQVLFVLWWYVLATSSALSSLQILLYVVGTLPIWFYQASGQLLLTLVIGGLGGLLYFLIYLYTGSTRSWTWLVGYYGILYVLLLGLVAASGTPTAIVDDGWALVRVPAPMTNLWLGLVFSLLFIGPQIGAAIGYALLYRRAENTAQRYRIALVSGSIIIWFGSSLIVGISGASQTPVAEVGSQLLAVLAALAILLGYQPPRAWRERWGLRSIRSEIEANTAPRAAGRE